MEKGAVKPQGTPSAESKSGELENGSGDLDSRTLNRKRDIRFLQVSRRPERGTAIGALFSMISKVTIRGMSWILALVALVKELSTRR